ncbi:MAG: GDSL-type esterase/lipase family protein [Elusimicrobia bacterium]|nr:GDSL-type esterase/lipase family protein [Candidatus Liberimonas magnetica]
MDSNNQPSLRKPHNAINKIIIGNLIAAAIIISTVWASNLIIRNNYMPLNDLYLDWLLNGKNYFVEAYRSEKNPAILMRTNKELISMDNTPESFSREKKPGAVRIFCVGGSTTGGWPFHKYLSYPRLMSLYLKDLLPDKRVEVINAGFMRSDSFSDISLVKEIQNYQPDLIILYEGRNEEPGISLHSLKQLWLMKTYLFILRNFHVFSNLKKSFNNEFNGAQGIRDLVQKMDKSNENKLRNFIFKNIMLINETAKANKCRIVLLTQVMHSSERNNGSVMNSINGWLKELSTKNGILLIDINEAFKNSVIPEEELVIPFSVHPDYRGYALMAKTVCLVLADENIIASKNKWEWKNLKDDTYYFDKLRFTPAFINETYYKRVLGLSKITDLNGFEKKYRQMAKDFVKNNSTK